MPEEKSELDKFLGDIPTEQQSSSNIFNVPEKDEKKEEEPKAEDDEPRKNRLHRRLEARYESQLREEREARIRAEARVEARAESDKFARESNVDPRLIEMYGDDDNGRKAARLHMQMLSEVEDRATEKAREELRQERVREATEEREYENYIFSQLESLEDTHNVDLTSNAPAAAKARRELLDMVQNLSPKGEDGTVTGFADFNSTYELYKLKDTRKQEASAQRKDIADRSMAPSGTVDVKKTEDDAQAAWLRRNGIRI